MGKAVLKVRLRQQLLPPPGHLLGRPAEHPAAVGPQHQALRPHGSKEPESSPHPFFHRHPGAGGVLPLLQHLPQVDGGKGEHRGGDRPLHQAEFPVPEEDHPRGIDGAASVHHGAAGPVAPVVFGVGQKGGVQPPGGRQTFLLGHSPVQEAPAGVFGAGEVQHPQPLLPGQLQHRLDGGLVLQGNAGLHPLRLGREWRGFLRREKAAPLHRGPVGFPHLHPPGGTLVPAPFQYIHGLLRDGLPLHIHHSFLWDL